MKRRMIWGLLLGAIIIAGCGTARQVTKEADFLESDGIFSYKVGQIEVYTLVEAQREGNAGILAGVDEAFLSQYIPSAGFMHSTNVFLIKAHGQNILIDTGFGTTIFEKIKKLGVEPDQINVVYLTHLHGDHIGGLQKDGVALFPNAIIFVPTKDREYFEAQGNAGLAAAFAPYPDNESCCAGLTNFEPAALDESFPPAIISGITPIANYGHTPGHTVYLIENNGEKLIIAGDFLHVALVQFANPDISATFDVDPIAAAASRRKLLNYATEHKIPIGGMHIVYPGIGTVEAAASGEGFTFTPVR
ncbi:MAG: MBL fold metallo-hydrolase [Treponema sp.]|nr:MBL fold metallo-hydrolase [Treponema sp.]